MMNPHVTLATLFWFEWSLAYAFVLGFGWRTARPIAIDVADSYGAVAGGTLFLLILGGIVQVI